MLQLLIMGNAHSSGTPLTALQSCLNTACTGSVGCVAFPTEPLYQLNWVKAYNLAIDITPAAVLRPQTAEQISAIVQCAAQNNMKVQAKSGGHSYGYVTSPPSLDVRLWQNTLLL